MFIPEYAKNFNKELSASDIKFYGKIHFNRIRSENELNMHCHLIISRKDQANKKKLSPLTNHKNTKNGIIKGGFDRVNLFQQAEQGFDKLFSYNRQLSESFNYYKTMKNGSITERLKLQVREVQSNERKTEIYQGSNRKNLLTVNLENKIFNESPFAQTSAQIYSPSIFTSSQANTPTNTEEELPKHKKKKRRRPKL